MLQSKNKELPLLVKIFCYFFIVPGFLITYTSMQVTIYVMGYVFLPVLISDVSDLISKYPDASFLLGLAPVGFIAVIFFTSFFITSSFSSLMDSKEITRLDIHLGTLKLKKKIL